MTKYYLLRVSYQKFHEVMIFTLQLFLSVEFWRGSVKLIRSLLLDETWPLI